MRVLVIIAATFGTILLLWIGWGAYVIYTTERPGYEVMRRLPAGVEIRQYGAQTWISTDYRSDESAFRVLASYIFGGNEQGRRVAMTAPVVTDRKMAFILPKGMTAESAPTPQGQPLEFQEVPPRSLATLRFSWTTPHDRVERKTKTLLATLKVEGVRAIGQPFLMRYNDPWTPPFMRRNEVAIEVE